MFTKRLVVNEDQLTERYSVRVGCECVVFDDEDSAQDFVYALMCAVGTTESRTVFVDETLRQYEFVLDTSRLSDRFEIENTNTDEKDDWISSSEAVAIVHCDGVGVCQCWIWEDGDSLPDGWQDYEHEGRTRHICPMCQDKEIKHVQVQVC